MSRDVMDPEIRLEAYEARVLGVLVEKALTTPEQYPLTLNAVASGANQRSNRDPVLDLSDDAVSEALDGLIDKQLARKVFPGNSRVDKFCHTGTSTLKVESPNWRCSPSCCCAAADRAERGSAAWSSEAPAGGVLSAVLGARAARLPRVPGRSFRPAHAQHLCLSPHPLDGSAAPLRRRPRGMAAPTQAALGVRSIFEAPYRRLEQLRPALGESLGPVCRVPWPTSVRLLRAPVSTFDATREP
jgi:hypothetical protein